MSANQKKASATQNIERIIFRYRVESFKLLAVFGPLVVFQISASVSYKHTHTYILQLELCLGVRGHGNLSVRNAVVYARAHSMGHS